MKPIADSNVRFGAFFKRKRIEAGMIAASVADKLGVSTSNIYMIENGQRNVDLWMALKLCDVVGADIREYIEAELAIEETPTV